MPNMATFNIRCILLMFQIVVKNWFKIDSAMFIGICLRSERFMKQGNILNEKIDNLTCINRKLQCWTMWSMSQWRMNPQCCSVLALNVVDFGSRLCTHMLLGLVKIWWHNKRNISCNVSTCKYEVRSLSDKIVLVLKWSNSRSPVIARIHGSWYGKYLNGKRGCSE